MAARVSVVSSSDRHLAPTSQFYFCSLPLRLDTYAGCGFGCSYCFAATRGGSVGSSRGSFNPKSLSDRFQRIQKRGPGSAVDELLANRQPIHLGGMSDPFMPQELTSRVSLNVLRILAEKNYPTVISTKADLFARPEYLEILLRGNFLLQVSFSTLDPQLAGRIERGTPTPLKRLRSMETVAARGLRVSVRHQPLLPGDNATINALVRSAASAGARHYGAEHLKLGLENSARQAVLSGQLPDVAELYDRHGVRSGRELVLRPELRVESILEARSMAHQSGLSFGAADSDLLPISDGDACCSGADLHLPNAGQPFRHTYLTAVRNSPDDVVAYDTIRSEWAPTGTIARFVNSHSRIGGAQGAGIKDYVRRNWNGRPNGPSPGMFAGVKPTERFDKSGFQLYAIEPWLRAAMTDRWPMTQPPVTN